MTVDTATGARGYWRGLGLWNIYFIAKLILYWSGYINFHAFYNLVFASVLLLPLPPLWLHRLRHVVAVPVGIALLYYDSWLPPFQRLLDQPEVLQFSVPYLIELLSRFINWNMVGAGIVLLVTCLFLSQWVRVTVLSVGALIVASLPAQFSVQQLARGLYAGHLTAIAEPAHASPAGGGANAQTVEPTKSITDILNQELTEFYDAELTRATMFDKPAAADQAYDFDIIFLSICSLSWSDLASEQLDQHPLLKSMDVVFDEFNAATAYSGPAIRRLLRASCGQPSHAALYEDAPQHCYLFDNLQQLGFKTDAVLNHDGKFQDFIGDLAQHDGLAEPLVPMALPARWTAFDGSPVWGDYETLTHWWQGRQHDTSPRAVLYNSVTLHDGNREATADGGGRSAPYATRGQVLLDDLNTFIKQLESNGRRAIVVLVPEHGAALVGDRMQISGMREIPTPEITHTPVGVKLIGHKPQEQAGTQRISGPSSYLALSELLARMLRLSVLDQERIDWNALTLDLPQTRAVSENAGTVLMTHSGVPQVRLGERDWIQYRR